MLQNWFIFRPVSKLFAVYCCVCYILLITYLSGVEIGRCMCVCVRVCLFKFLFIFYVQYYWYYNIYIYNIILYIMAIYFYIVTNVIWVYSVNYPVN